MSLISGLTNQVLDYVYSVTRNVFNDTARIQQYTNLPCRWQPKTERITTPNGEELVSTIQVWVEPENTINEDYEIVKGSKTYRIGIKQDKYDLDGNLDHIKFYLV